MYWWALAVVLGLLAVLTQLHVEKDPEVLQRSVVLIGTPTAVYRYASDFKLYAKWFPTVYSYESLDERSMAVGKQYIQHSYIPWIGERKHTILVVDYDPPRFLAYIEDAWSLPKVEIYVESVNSKHTRFTWRLTSRWRNGFFKYVVAPMLKFFYDGRVKQAMLNLRALFQK